MTGIFTITLTYAVLQMSDAVRVMAVEQSMSEMLFQVESSAVRELSPIEHM